MGFYRGPNIYKKGLISGHDDLSPRCVNVNDLSSTTDLVDGTIWQSNIETPVLNADGTISYSGTYYSARSYTDQSDLSSNIKTSGTGGGTEEYTLELWFKKGTGAVGVTTSGWQLIGNNSATGVGVQLITDAGIVKINVGNRTNSNDYCDTCDIQDDIWYHAVMTRIDPGTGTACTRLYINGVLDYEQCSNTFCDVDANSAAMMVGRTPGRITGVFQGVIPIRRIYNVGLTEEQVLQNFNAQKDRFGL